MITPLPAYTGRLPTAKSAPNWIPNLTTIFILSCLILNYNNFTRIVGGVILSVTLVISVLSGFGPRDRWLKAGAIFGFILVLFNALFKFETISFTGDSAAEIEFITPMLAFWFFATVFLLRSQSPDQLSQAVDRAVLGFILISLFDLSLRVLEAGPGCFSLTSGCRTAAKFGGLAFNSNIVAVSIVTCLFFARKIPIFVILSVLLYATMNRSGLFASAIGLAVLIAFERDLSFLHKFKRSVRLLFIMPLLAFLLFYFRTEIQNYIINDGSFNSKISFIEYAIYNLKLSSLSIILFGDQLNFYHIIYTYSFNDWSVHLAIVKALWYFGIVGVIFYLLINLTLMFYSFRSALCILVYLIMGLSGFAIFNATMLVIPLFAAAFLHKNASSVATARPLFGSNKPMAFGD